MIELIKATGLIKTVEDVSLFYPQLIPKLIVNLPAEVIQLQDSCTLRGIYVTISPTLLNQFLGLSMPDDLSIK